MGFSGMCALLRRTLPMRYSAAPSMPVRGNTLPSLPLRHITTPFYTSAMLGHTIRACALLLHGTPLQHLRPLSLPMRRSATQSVPLSCLSIRALAILHHAACAAAALHPAFPCLCDATRQRASPYDAITSYAARGSAFAGPDQRFHRIPMRGPTMPLQDRTNGA